MDLYQLLLNPCLLALVYFLGKQNSNNTCFTSNWKRLLLMRDISVRTVLQHKWSSLSLRLTRIVTEKVFIHRIAASFIICHTQAGLGASKIVHLAGTVAFAFGSCAAHVVSLLMPDGAGGFVIRTGTSLSLSNCHAFPSGEGTFWIDTRALFQTKVWKFALSIWWKRHSYVGGRSSLFRLSWQKRKYRASSAFTKFLQILTFELRPWRR